MKILFVTLNPKSLNSLNLGICLAKGFQKINKDIAFLFATTSDFTDFFYRNKFPFTKILNDSIDVIISTIRSFSPNYVFFTEDPGKEVLQFTKENGIFSYFLDTHYQKIKNQFDKIFVLYPKENKEDSFKKKSNRLHVGYLFRKGDKKHNLSINRKAFSILITLGSGSELNAYLEESLQAVLKFKARHKNVKINLILGPFFPHPEKYKIKGVDVKRYVPNILEIIASSDVIITKPSYSSILESHSKNLILIGDLEPHFNIPVFTKESEIYHYLNLAYLSKIQIKRPDLNPDIAVNNIYKTMINDKPFQELSLMNKTLTSALANLSITKDTILLDFQEFSWFDLLLVIEYLINKNVKYFYLKLHQKTIPKKIIEKLNRYPIAFVVNKKTPLIEALKKQYFPVIIQNDNPSGTTPKMANRTEHLPFIKDSFRSVIQTLEKEIKQVEQEKENLLLKHNIETKHLILSRKQKRIQDEFNKNKIKNIKIYNKINELEFAKDSLMKSKKIKEQFLKIEKEKAQISKKISSFYDKNIKQLEQEMMLSEYRIYLLLKEHNLINVLNQRRIDEIQEQIKKQWQEQEDIQHQINKFKQTQKELCEHNKELKNYNELNESITSLKFKKDKLWEKFNQINQHKIHEISAFKSNPNPQIQKYFNLVNQKNKIETKFNLIINEKFNPIKTKLAIAELNKQKEIKELQKQKEEMWNKFLAPLEKQLDILTAKISNFRSTSGIADVFKKHFKNLTKIETQEKQISREINEIKNKIEINEEKTNQIKIKNKNLQFFKIEDQISKKELEKEEISYKVKKLESQKTQIQKNFENQIKDEKIFVEYNELQNKITNLNKKIQDWQSKIKSEKEKLYFLSQKEAYTLRAILPELNKINNKLTEEYNKINEIESGNHEIRKEIHFAIIRLLKENNIYEKWQKLGGKEKQLRFILQTKHRLYN